MINLQSLQTKIDTITFILGEGSEFLDDEILLGEEEEKTMLFSHRDYLITFHDDGRFTYWKLEGDFNPDDVRRYCGLRSEDEIISKDIFLAGYYNPVIPNGVSNEV